MDRFEAVARAQDRVTVEKVRLILSIVLLMFSLWQMEIILIYGKIGWPTDIFWVQVPAWMAATFYTGLIAFAWLLKPIKRINLTIIPPPTVDEISEFSSAS